MDVTSNREREPKIDRFDSMYGLEKANGPWPHFYIANPRGFKTAETSCPICKTCLLQPAMSQICSKTTA